MQLWIKWKLLRLVSIKVSSSSSVDSIKCFSSVLPVIVQGLATLPSDVLTHPTICYLTKDIEYNSWWPN